MTTQTKTTKNNIKKWTQGGMVTPEYFAIFGTKDFKIIHDGEFDIAYVIDERHAKHIIHTTNNFLSLVEALRDLVLHDVASDKREGIDHCVELTRAIDVVKEAENAGLV